MAPRSVRCFGLCAFETDTSSASHNVIAVGGDFNTTSVVVMIVIAIITHSYFVLVLLGRQKI